MELWYWCPGADYGCMGHVYCTKFCVSTPIPGPAVRRAYRFWNWSIRTLGNWITSFSKAVFDISHYQYDSIVVLETVMSGINFYLNGVRGTQSCREAGK